MQTYRPFFNNTGRTAIPRNTKNRLAVNCQPCIDACDQGRGMGAIIVLTTSI